MIIGACLMNLLEKMIWADMEKRNVQLSLEDYQQKQKTTF
jgi:hypothetical protein